VKVLFPTTLAEACAMRAESEATRGAIPVAGGTDVLVHWPERLELRDRTFIDLGRVGELRYARLDDDWLELGALATYWGVQRDPAIAAAFPLLVEAARVVGAIQIQARGTWAGNVANASPAADGVPALMAYDAVLVIASPAGRREVPLDRFYSGYKKFDLHSDELIAAIRIPRRAHTFERFVKVGPRRAQAIAKVGVAVARSDHGWRVVAASVAPTVRRCRGVESLLDRGERPAAPEDLLPVLREDVSPIDDVRSTATYREAALARVLHDALADAGAADR
jgi:CO/xanthine dehydrogenase FAD-binding subunit